MHLNLRISIIQAGQSLTHLPNDCEIELFRESVYKSCTKLLIIVQILTAKEYRIHVEQLTLIESIKILTLLPSL